MKLLLTKVVDPMARENFQKLDSFIATDPLITSEFKPFEIQLTKAETNKRIPHGLGFVPKDVIQTSSIGAGSITWNYTLFTDEFIDVSSSGACTVRVLLGNSQAVTIT